ncbi:scabin-related ADP-ribosyltransferase [Xanthomonas oryzae]|uniref:scabin-related ADP-ribosyltransferase n=1 Tax=Xanthomonas oryzae TaxID=347 RepID=UPI0011F344F2|nr:hypothetical protein [Xanthomonas oryzae]UBB93574.1 hypothetical protein K2I41_03150 [Xanthomonas oryzae pv. oryzicola]
MWEENKHLFAYDGVDAIGDWATKNQVGARALGGLQMLGGAAESAGAIMLAPTCETGIGCVASVYLTGAGADNAAAGAITLFSGKATSTLGGQALQALGLQPGTAELLYGFTQMAPSVGAAIAANRAINLEIAANALARSTYTGSVATTDTVAGSAPKFGFIFRGDARSPDVIFEEGLQPRGTNTDLYNYALQNEPSVFVSTSKSPNVARDFVDMQGGGYVYTIRGRP